MRAATLHLLSVCADLAHDKHAVQSGYSHKSKRKKRKRVGLRELEAVFSYFYL